MVKQDTTDTADEVHELMTVKQAAEYLQVNPKTLYRWLAEGDIPGVKLGGRSWRVQRGTLTGWVRRQSIENVIANAPRVTQEWLDEIRQHREEMLEDMGGEPFRGDEIEQMVREGRK